jgi:DMSO/TMAO reductase YedYZ heme-binding membrane subunit
MALKTRGLIFLLGVVALSIGILASVLSTSYASPLGLLVRLFALYGYFALSIATAMTPFLREVTQAFGRPFVKIHHTFAAAGIVFSTAHPVAYAIQSMDIGVFLPTFESWTGFWTFAGRPALLIMYVAVAGVLLRRRIQRHWRSVHALMYLVLFFGIVHASFLGTDFQSIAIRVLYSVLFAASMTAFILKRLKKYL